MSDFIALVNLLVAGFVPIKLYIIIYFIYIYQCHVEDTTSITMFVYTIVFVLAN